MPTNFQHFTYNGNGMCSFTHGGDEYRVSVTTHGPQNGSWFMYRVNDERFRRVEIPAHIAKGPETKLESYLTALF